jgi:hypothetical protein
MVILQLEFVVPKVGNKDMNSLNDVKISLEVSLIFVSAFGLVDNHVKFIIFTTCQGINYFLQTKDQLHANY